MTSKRPPWTREEFDAKLAELAADPAKAASFKADLVERIGKAFEDLSKVQSSSERDSEEQEIRRKIESYVEERARAKFGSDLRVSFPNAARTYVGFDLWYATDEQLQQDTASGRHGELTAIFSEAARECAGAEPVVHFHSHQHVREKWGGNYYNYCYFGLLR